MNPYLSAYKRNASQQRVRDRKVVFSSAALAAFFLLGLSLLVVYKQTLGQHLLAEVQRLRVEQKGLVTEQSVLLGEKQQSLSRVRVIAYARERLGLEFPAPESIHWIKAESLYE